MIRSFVSSSTLSPTVLISSWPLASRWKSLFVTSARSPACSSLLFLFQSRQLVFLCVSSFVFLYIFLIYLSYAFVALLLFNYIPLPLLPPIWVINRGWISPTFLFCSLLGSGSIPQIEWTGKRIHTSSPSVLQSATATKTAQTRALSSFPHCCFSLALPLQTALFPFIFHIPRFLALSLPNSRWPLSSPSSFPFSFSSTFFTLHC